MSKHITIQAGERFVNLDRRCKAIGYTSNETQAMLQDFVLEGSLIVIRVGDGVGYECLRLITIRSAKDYKKPKETTKAKNPNVKTVQVEELQTIAVPTLFQ